MSTIISYPLPARDLDGGEALAAFQDGKQVQVQVATVAPVVAALIAGEMNPEASAYASWQMLPGNGGKSRADYIASLKGAPGEPGPPGPIGSDTFDDGLWSATGDLIDDGAWG